MAATMPATDAHTKEEEMLFGVALVIAQILNSMQAYQAYTVYDPNPIAENGIGLYTTDGGFAITPMSDCDWLAPYQNVWIFPSYNMPPWLSIAPVGSDETALPGCIVRVEGQRSAKPCAQVDGLCDVSTEVPMP